MYFPKFIFLLLTFFLHFLPLRAFPNFNPPTELPLDILSLLAPGPYPRENLIVLAILGVISAY